jgi:site-specific DNA recombinase
MTPSHTTKGGSKRYRYYTCVKAQKMGHASCPSKSVPAGPLEGHVVEQIRAIGRDLELVAQTIAQARQQDQLQLTELEAERRTLEKDLIRWDGELRVQTARLAHSDDVGAAVARLSDLQNRIDMGKRRLAKVREQQLTLRQNLLHEEDARLALAQFDPVWEALPPHEQARLLGLLVERIDYDGAKGTLEITFHQTGIKTLADELASNSEEMTA